ARSSYEIDRRSPNVLAAASPTNSTPPSRSHRKATWPVQRPVCGITCKPSRSSMTSPSPTWRSTVVRGTGRRSFKHQRFLRVCPSIEKYVVDSEVLQLFDFAEKPLASAILQKSQSLIVRHLGKAVFEQNRDFSEESNLCNTSKMPSLEKFASELSSIIPAANAGAQPLLSAFAPESTIFDCP